ncbi:MAG: hypothetical protein ACK521_11115 [bacterium]
MPLFIFYAFRQTTHSCDCFNCFNRIPHLRYSIYQYTKREKNEFIMQRQIGMGAVKALDELVDRET